MKRLLLCCSAAALVAGATPAAAQIHKPILGQVMLVAFDYCPQGWVEAGGQFLSIAQNTAMFALIGATYGGNGQTTIALPDLRGRVPVGSGQGKDLKLFQLGEIEGEAETTMTLDKLPFHTHNLVASSGPPASKDPAGRQLATFPAAAPGIYGKSPPAPLDLNMNTDSIAMTGGGQPFNQRQPTLSLRYCISVAGEFPKFQAISRPSEPTAKEAEQ